MALLSGSLRDGSTNTSVLRTAAAVAPGGVETVLVPGLGELPLFSPDRDAEGVAVPGPVAALRAVLGEADAVMICTPEYAGALPAALKNALEWTVGAGTLYEKPVGWLNVSSVAAPRGGRDAHESLRLVLRYVSADIVEEAVLTHPVSRDGIGEDGVFGDAELRDALRGCLEALASRFP